MFRHCRHCGEALFHPYEKDPLAVEWFERRHGKCPPETEEQKNWASVWKGVTPPALELLAMSLESR
jgi:hypothetical protein